MRCPQCTLHRAEGPNERGALCSQGLALSWLRQTKHVDSDRHGAPGGQVLGRGSTRPGWGGAAGAECGGEGRHLGWRRVGRRQRVGRQPRGPGGRRAGPRGRPGCQPRSGAWCDGGAARRPARGVSRPAATARRLRTQGRAHVRVRMRVHTRACACKAPVMLGGVTPHSTVTPLTNYICGDPVSS